VSRKKGPYRNGLVHVCRHMCETCIFRPGDLMQLKPGRVRGMVDEALARDSAIICHSTLDGYKSLCRGFFDKYKTQSLQIAERLNLSVFTNEKD
jgi:hypothetical protein